MNPSRETKFSGTHGDKGIFLPCSADHEQDWQPYPVDTYSAICDDHTYIHAEHSLFPQFLEEIVAHWKRKYWNYALLVNIVVVARQLYTSI